jgi:hypothetical protein
MTVQYLKHYYVSYQDKNIVLSDTNDIAGGKTHPAIVGLDVIMQLADANGIDYCLSITTEQTYTDVPGVTLLSEDEWKTEWEQAFYSIKNKLIENVYLEYKQKFENLPDKFYHPYEMLYSNYIKRVEASLITTDMNSAEAALVAPVLALESSERGIDIKSLASKVLAHASIFDETQARLLAARGKEVDIISSKVCNVASVDSIRESIDSLLNIPE